MMIKLSICIATYNRGDFIAETLISIASQVCDGVEIVVLDGNSPDNTEKIVKELAGRFSGIRYFRESENSGVDIDFNKAVLAARGTYCWLLSDDDLMLPRAIDNVLSAIEMMPSLIIVNAAIKNHDLSTLLHAGLFQSTRRRFLSSAENDFLSSIGHALSFIGCVVIRRDRWLARNASNYFGTLFAHVGVILQAPPLEDILVLDTPFIDIRYGNAMWSARGFEIWMFKWPNLIWSFSHYSPAAKYAVTPKEPWRQFKRLVLYRGIGGYSTEEYVRLIKPRAGGLYSFIALVIAATPAKVVNTVSSLYCLIINRNATSGAYDLGRSVNATWVSKMVAKRLLVSHK